MTERNRIQFEEGRLSFPEDFPGSQANFQHENFMSDNMTREYAKRPPAKRPNYFKLKINHPFTSPYKEILGIPEFGDMVILTGTLLQAYKDWIFQPISHGKKSGTPYLQLQIQLRDST